MTLPDEDFEELRALKADMAARHRRLVLLLLAIGAGLLGLAALAYVLLDTDEKPWLLMVPVVLGSGGVAIVLRALRSAFTDVDTRPEPEPKPAVVLPDEEGDEDASAKAEDER